MPKFITLYHSSKPTSALSSTRWELPAIADADVAVVTADNDEVLAAAVVTEAAVALVIEAAVVVSKEALVVVGLALSLVGTLYICWPYTSFADISSKNQNTLSNFLTINISIQK